MDAANPPSSAFSAGCGLSMAVQSANHLFHKSFTCLSAHISALAPFASRSYTPIPYASCAAKESPTLTSSIFSVSSTSTISWLHSQKAGMPKLNGEMFYPVVCNNELPWHDSSTTGLNTPFSMNVHQVLRLKWRK